MNKIIAFFRGLFNPGLLQATVEMRHAIETCNGNAERTGHRFYAIWDPYSKSLMCLSYEQVKDRMDSYILLRKAGKVRPMTRNQLRSSCYYYSATSSKPGSQMPRYIVDHKIEVLRRRCFCRR